MAAAAEDRGKRVPDPNPVWERDANCDLGPRVAAVPGTRILVGQQRFPNDWYESGAHRTSQTRLVRRCRAE